MTSKYRNKRVSADGFGFDSQAEMRRYYELKILLFAKKITNLEVHPKWDLVVNDVKICRYEADFSYLDLEPTVRALVVEDVKGVRTAVFKMKKKLMKAVRGIEVVEVAA